jgi:hypothetical protein
MDMNMFAKKIVDVRYQIALILSWSDIGVD